MNPRPRVLFAVVDWFPHGGMQRTLRRLAIESTARGLEVTILATTFDGDPPAGVLVRLVPTSAPTNYGRNRALGRHVATIRSDFDLVVGFNKIPGLDVYYAGDPCWAAELQRRPFATVLRLLPRHRAYLELERSVFGEGSGTEILLIAHDRMAEFRRYYGTEAERFHLMPPGIDRERLERASTKGIVRDSFLAGLGLDPRMPSLLTIGSGFRTKGIDRVLRAIPSIEARTGRLCTYVVVGEDARVERYIALARRLSIAERVVFTGPRVDAADFYFAADLLVHPARLENTGTTLVEAMIAGCPVIATANCGFASHVSRAAAGLVVGDPFDAVEFEDAVITALDPTRREAFARGGSTYVATVDVTGLIDKATEVIFAAASRRRVVPRPFKGSDRNGP